MITFRLNKNGLCANIKETKKSQKRSNTVSGSTICAHGKFFHEQFRSWINSAGRGTQRDHKSLPYNYRQSCLPFSMLIVRNLGALHLFNNNNNNNMRLQKVRINDWSPNSLVQWNSCTIILLSVLPFLRSCWCCCCVHWFTLDCAPLRSAQR